MPAKLVSDDGAHVVIRPLVFVGEDEARAYTKEQDLPVIGCCCPACGDLGLQRQRAKRLLMEMEREHPGVKQSMIKALANVAPRHLLDTRLNPPADLVRRTGEPRTAPVPAARARPIKVTPVETAERDNHQSSAITATSALIVGGAVSSSE
jgi:tRNA(Ile)-lysidine synthase TilS/MesJ